MSRYVKGVSETTRLSNSLVDLHDELKLQRLSTNKNSKELEKLNELTSQTFENKIKSLEGEIKKLQTQSTQWVTNEEPAVKLTTEHILKKLDVL